MNLDLPNDVYSVLEKRAKEQNYENTEKYIIFLLEQIVEKINAEKNNGKNTYTKEEQDKIKNRLQSLGYID